MKKHIGSIMAAIIIMIAVALALLMNSCSMESRSSVAYRTYTDAEVAANCARRDSLSMVAQQDTAKWQQFLECSKDEGDAGCDSCFTMIYGYSLEER